MFVCYVCVLCLYVMFVCYVCVLCLYVMFVSSRVVCVRMLSLMTETDT